MDHTQNKNKLSVALDFGASGLKCIYQLAGLPTNSILYMEPPVIEASAQELKSIYKGLGGVLPENKAWVGIDNDYRAVGYLAQTKWEPVPQLKQKKHSLAIYRVLAAIWVIKERLSLPDSFECSIAVLLPPSEMSDSQTFLKNLRSALKNFTTPTGKLKIKMRSKGIICIPEGCGILTLYYNKYEAIAQKNTTLVLMLGYRNASVLVSSRGIPSTNESTNLGMNIFLDILSKYTSGLSHDLLVKILNKPQLKLLDLIPLTEKHLEIEARTQEAKKILDAIEISKAEYASRLKQWISEKLPSEVHHIVIGGGTAGFISPQLEDLFPANPIIWNGDFSAPSHWEQEEIFSNRFADIYGVWSFFQPQDKVKELQQIT